MLLLCYSLFFLLLELLYVVLGSSVYPLCFLILLRYFPSLCLSLLNNRSNFQIFPPVNSFLAIFNLLSLLQWLHFFISQTYTFKKIISCNWFRIIYICSYLALAVYFSYMILRILTMYILMSCSEDCNFLGNEFYHLWNLLAIMSLVFIHRILVARPS